MKLKSLHLYLLGLFLFISTYSHAQYIQEANLPYADQKMYHFGFNLGMHTQSMPIINTGFQQTNGEVWFAGIPSYSLGFNIGIIADLYLNEHFNLRTNPTVYFGEKSIVFKEESNKQEDYKKVFKANYLTLPIHVKFSGTRTKNFRPYLIAGPYASFAIANKKNEAIRFRNYDIGLDFGIGCNLYLPYFKLSPELRFSLGLINIVNTKRSDLANPELVKYSDAISSGKNRMISLIFNFE